MARSENERGMPVVFKHRIVGAVVLVALAVLVLPVILNLPAPVAQERPAVGAEPGKEATKLFVSRITPAGETTKPEQVNKSVSGALPPVVAQPAPAKPDLVPTIPPKAEGPAKAETAAADKPKSKPPATGVTPVPKAETSETAKAAGATVAKPAAEKPKEVTAVKTNEVVAEQKPVKVKSGWIVQAGVYSQQVNADRIAARLKSAGYRPTVGPVSYTGKQYFRVYVGPYATRDEAARVSAKVGPALREKVAVVAFP